MSKPQKADNVLEDGKVLNAKNDLAEEEKKIEQQDSSVMTPWNFLYVLWRALPVRNRFNFTGTHPIISLSYAGAALLLWEKTQNQNSSITFWERTARSSLHVAQKGW